MWLQDMLASGDTMPLFVPEGHKSTLRTALPKFDGDPLRWTGFCSMFNSLVHQTNKTDAEKLTLLQQAMGPGPKKLIINLKGG